MPTVPTLRRRILVADDVPGTIDVLTRALTRRGYDVAQARDGEEALRQVELFRPDLVILDIMMPKVHGIDVLKAVRADPATRDIGFIVCSARSFSVDLKQVHDLGVFDFFDKAHENLELLKKVEAFFDQRGAEAPAVAAGEEEGVASPAGGPPSAAGGGAARVVDPGVERFQPSLDDAEGYWKMWGTRGSIPVSGPRFARHGGNTSCLEVRVGEHVVIIDAGSGIRDLGMKLMKAGPRSIPLLIGHTHWDHIQGFPFFTPAYVPGYEVEIYGASGFGKDLHDVFRGQLDRDYFPVEMQDMAARLEFRHLHDNPIRFGPIAIYWEMMNHPGATVGFRIEAEGTRVGYVTDNEFLKGYLGSPYGLTASSDIVLPYQRIIQFVSNVDVLIMEAQYTNQEYAAKIGWGHSVLSSACLLAKLANAKRWVVTHHDPMHDDDFLQEKLNLTRQILKKLDYPIEVTNGFDGCTGYF